MENRPNKPSWSAQLPAQLPVSPWVPVWVRLASASQHRIWLQLCDLLATWVLPEWDRITLLLPLRMGSCSICLSQQHACRVSERVSRGPILGTPWPPALNWQTWKQSHPGAPVSFQAYRDTVVRGAFLLASLPCLQACHSWDGSRRLGEAMCNAPDHCRSSAGVLQGMFPMLTWQGRGGFWPKGFY